MPTTNHSLNTPSEGEQDWHTPLNQNFEDIDQIVPIFDADTNLSSYTPQTNAIFCATDTGNWYRGDGNSWSKFGEFGGSSGTLTAAMDITTTNDGSVALAEDGRLLYSQDHKLSYIDPSSGGSYSTASGSSSDPYATVNDALYYLGYSCQLHEFQIELDNPGATYAAFETPPTTLGYRGKFGNNSQLMFLLRGDPNSPTDFTFSGTPHIGFDYANDIVNAELRGCHFPAGIAIDGQARFEDCHFGGVNNPGGSAIVGNTGRCEFQNCTFTSNADTAIRADHFKQCSFRKCDFDVANHIFEVPTDNSGSGPFWFDHQPLDSNSNDVPLFASSTDRQNCRAIGHFGGAEFTGTDAVDVVVA